jgi:hypothetical protein
VVGQLVLLLLAIGINIAAGVAAAATGAHVDQGSITSVVLVNGALAGAFKGCVLDSILMLLAFSRLSFKLRRALFVLIMCVWTVGVATAIGAIISFRVAEFGTCSFFLIGVNAVFQSRLS